MKSLQSAMNDSVNEARNTSYSVAFNINGKIIETDVVLRNPSNAKDFDKWLEEEIDNVIYHADGGPNDVEL
jgi:hypothetical protein